MKWTIQPSPMRGMYLWGAVTASGSYVVSKDIACPVDAKQYARFALSYKHWHGETTFLGLFNTLDLAKEEAAEHAKEKMH